MKAYCPECGIEISTDDVFCGNCGISITPPVQKDVGAPETISSPPANQAAAPMPDTVQETVKENTLNSPVQSESFDSAVESSPISPDKNEQSFESGLSDALKDEKKVSAADESEVIPDHRTVENWTMKTESVELPPLNFARKDEFSNFSSDSVSANDTPSAAANSENSEESFGEDNKQSHSMPAQTSAAQKNAVETDEKIVHNSEPGSEEKVSAEISASQNNLSAEPVKNSVNSEPAKGLDEESDIDFQSTIPYTPKDFAAQNSIASQVTNNEPDKTASENSAELKNTPPAENSSAIESPSIPVGSSMHDSLEPTSISVQIYDPKEKSPEAEHATLIKSTKDIENAIRLEDSQKEPPSQTSPNIGGTETDGKGKAKLKPLDEGTLLNNRYEIVRKIGGGGMGAVYLASDRNLGGISRAVKEMVQSYIEDSQQEKAVNDFRRESMLLTSLEHPSIPTIFDYFFDEKEARFYLVMKYISGGDLAARLRAASEGRIDEATVTDWAIQIADVLDYLHNRQPPIVYRDLKPSNIMIDGNTGKVMLIDFGIARWVNKEEKGVTAVGTMGYAPPELFSGNVEPRSDIYSLGSTMFHLLTGADPQSNPLLIFDFHKNPRPRQINPQLTDQMEQILMKTVEYSADKRFANAAELRDALVNHLDNLKRGNVTVGVADSAKPSASAANQLVFCGFCGQKILASDVFCPFCGAQQAVGGQAAKAVAKTTAKLLIIGTNELDSPVFNLEKDTNLVGRRDPMSNIFPEVDLSKFDPQTKISRRHARIWREKDSFMVEDLGSSNGTILLSPVNEPQKLGKNQPRILANGDKIRVGDTTLHFILGG